ncbi:general secretion pathway protein GspK [Shewanella psychromarinicola]|jgi:general secretion pathway protein K|uniref:general secretion pathway protein GspK n=1 Tax=Shewanella psychromarinicola TaxID=2487742 RepID=UPI003F4C0FC3
MKTSQNIYTNKNTHYCYVKQKGIALLIVLWMSILLTSIVSGFAYYSQIEGLLTRRSVDRLTATEAVKAGLALTVYQLKYASEEQPVWADGRPYSINFDDVKLTIRIQDEGGKLSINGASAELWTSLFVSVGVDNDKANELADAILDFRDSDSEYRLLGAEVDDYAQAGLLAGPKNDNIIATEELLQVYGLDYDIFKQIQYAVSPYTFRAEPDWRVGPATILNMLPDMNEAFISTYLAARSTETSTTNALPSWPDGRQLFIHSGDGPIYTIDIKATLSNNSTHHFIITINTQSETFFAIKSWQEKTAASHDPVLE